MQFKSLTLVAVAAALCSVVSAAGDTSLDLCFKNNSAGCQRVHANYNQCYDFANSWVDASGLPLARFNDKVNSIKVIDLAGKPQGRCNIFENTGCGGDVGGPIGSGNPHPDLNAVGKWGNKISSVRCIAN
ncbi:hypothetical protein NPX13_g4553 [Xylaria arbuscula]|uniref:Uncharacterized protein n=1 Tax=Xylaria arbuscula TaxID=114810 RepID=A0A9W8NGK1_9PEZI|nr:hypothetical protein NPX13_g4553 [Xylaria arbuscula]